MKMKRTYVLPQMANIDLFEKDGILGVTSATFGAGDGEDYVKAEIVWDEEEQRRVYTNYNIWDEEW